MRAIQIYRWSSTLKRKLRRQVTLYGKEIYHVKKNNRFRTIRKNPLVRLALDPSFKTKTNVSQLAILQKDLKIQNLVFSNGEVVIDRDDGLKFIFREEDHPFFLKNLPEHEHLEYVKQLLKPNSHVLDVGSHVGLYAIYLATQLRCRAYAFEAAMDTAAALEKNVRINKLEEQIRVVNKAVLDEDKLVHFTKGLSGENHLLRNKSLLYQEVKATSLDNFARKHKLKKIDFIKLDIEGSEMLALRGARNLLEKFSPLLLVEICSVSLGRLGFSEKEVFDLLDSYDYKIIKRFRGNCFFKKMK